MHGSVRAWIIVYLTKHHLSVIIAMRAAGAVQMTIHEIIDMISMWNRIVPAGGAMFVRLIVGLAGMFWSTAAGVGRRMTD